MSKNKRGPRKNKRCKRYRDALKAEAAGAAVHNNPEVGEPGTRQATSEEFTILPPTESETITGQAIEADSALGQLDLNRRKRRLSTPDEGSETDESEMSWSRSPSSHWRPPVANLFEEKPSEEKPSEEVPFEEVPFEEEPSEEAPPEEKPSEEEPFEEEPFEEAPFEEAPFEEAPSEEAPSEEEDYVNLPVQPTGDICVIICRLSSDKAAPDPTGTKTRRQRTQENRGRRKQEGLILASRLEQNCPSKDFRFRQTIATCGVRHSHDTTIWTKNSSAASEFVRDIRRVFQHPDLRNQKVTVVIRSVDGLTTDKRSFRSFLEMIKACGITAQLIFQFNKVCDDIRPLVLRNFSGLGATADFSAADFLAHLKGEQDFPSVERICTIWETVAEEKGVQQGVQDRNTLPGENQDRPEEVRSLSNSAGRRKK